MKITKRYLFIILSVVLLTGCALGPDYSRPQMDVPVAYKTDAPWKAATPQEAADKGRWWEIYNDPMLNKLQEQTLEANQELQVALARLIQVSAGERISRARQLPSVDLAGSASRSRTAADFSSNGKDSTGNTFSLPFVLGYELDLWGRVKRSVEAAAADTAGAEADYHNLMLSLQGAVALNYFDLRAIDQEIALLNKTVRLMEEARDLIKRQYDHGRVSKLDMTQAETQLAETRSEAISLEKKRGELENALAVLTGQAASDFALTLVPLNTSPPALVAGLPSSLLERRPDVAAAERRMAAASARIGVAETAFFPAISLTGNAGYASTALDDLFNWNNRIWGIGPAISLPIFDGGRNDANLERAKAAYEEAVAAYRQQVLVAFQEVEDGLKGLEVLDRQGAMLQEAVSSAQQALAISESRYKHGRVNFLEVVDSYRTALRIQRNLARLRGDQFTTSVSLIKALGGGWEG